MHSFDNRYMAGIFIPAIVFLVTLSSCRNRHSLFTQIPSAQSGIHFNNLIVENDSINPLDLEFLYNGGGVAVGNFNGDSLPDLYFTGNITGNKLYLNKGDFVFEDITDSSATTGEGRWCSGVAVVDINNDSLDDLYICATIKRDPAQRRNLLYVNQGMRNGAPVFKESAKDYGLADTGYSVQSAFFDYDNDGDLDLYLMQTKMSSRNASTFYGRNDTSGIDIDKLYRNDWNDSLRHAVFTDVSAAAGIIHHGYGLGIGIADLNNDNYKDIYVSNDFYSNDHLYLNNKNGTFSNTARTSFKHTSQNAMGNDIADINNDGLPDIFTADMNPESNFRKKKNMNGNNYNIYQQMTNGPYLLQYVRNTLQLNGGAIADTPVFSDIAYLSGVAATDWSWNPFIADMDNDGYRDLLITNGYPRDVTDRDFIMFKVQNEMYRKKSDIIDSIPQIRIPNYAYRNTGQLQFEDVSAKWGLSQSSFSNGAVYADLDNDGDLDYVISNINEEAFVFRNNLSKDSAYLKVAFKGDNKNIHGIGAKLTLFYDHQLQVAENSPYRGYLSSISNNLHFGLGKHTMIDSIVVEWANRQVQVLKHVAANQTIVLRQPDAAAQDHLSKLSAPALFEETHAIVYQHQERDFIDFDRQRLLPHKLSEYGPCLAAGDLDGNGLDDLAMGGNADQAPALFFQQEKGAFISKNLPAGKADNTGVLLFDVDNDQDLDLYFTSGGNELPANDTGYRDQLLLNDGRGNFALAETALPENFTSKSCVRAADIDQDGDLDLFIGGRARPGRYPEAVSSYIYRNDSQKGSVKFSDITASAAPGLTNIGLVCDALFSDVDKDGQQDLVIAGEWMPIAVFKNMNGRFAEITETGIRNYKGFWNSLCAADLDHDGDIDFVAGNMGLNSYYRGDTKEPVRIYSGDFGGNQGFTAIPTLYLKDEKGIKKEYPAQTRDDLVDPLPALKKQFLSYAAFGRADINALLGEKKKNALVLEANECRSSWIENKGNGRFDMHPLPMIAQSSAVFGIQVKDINQDGHSDIIAVGNDWGAEPSVGRYDALNGLTLLGDSKGNFTPLSFTRSGFYVPGNARALVQMIIHGETVFAATQNRDSLKLFRLK